jgi:hypothetical protein
MMEWDASFLFHRTLVKKERVNPKRRREEMVAE